MRLQEEDRCSDTTAVEVEKKQVRFADTDVQYSYEMDNDLIEELWYNSHDFMAFRFENAIIIKAVKEGASLDENEFCTRGLEKKIDDSWPQGSRQKTVQIVLSEQDMQRKLGYRSVHAMERISRSCTQWDRYKALTLAALDAFFYEEQQPSPGARRKIVAIFENEENKPARYTPISTATATSTTSSSHNSPRVVLEDCSNATYETSASKTTTTDQQWQEPLSPRGVWQQDTWWKQQTSAEVSKAELKHKTKPSVIGRQLSNMLASRQTRQTGRNGGVDGGANHNSLGCLFCQTVPV